MAIAFAIKGFGLHIPPAAITLLEVLSQPIGVLMMVALGLAFAPKLSHLGKALIAVFIRMGLGFAAGFALSLLFGLQGVPRLVVLTCSALPVGFNTLIFADRENMDRSFAATMVSVSTLISSSPHPADPPFFLIRPAFRPTRLRAGVVAFSAGREWGADKRGCVAKKRRTAKSVDSFALRADLTKQNNEEQMKILVLNWAVRPSNTSSSTSSPGTCWLKASRKGSGKTSRSLPTKARNSPRKREMVIENHGTGSPAHNRLAAGQG